MWFWHVGQACKDSAGRALGECLVRRGNHPPNGPPRFHPVPWTFAGHSPYVFQGTVGTHDRSQPIGEVFPGHDEFGVDISNEFCPL